MDSIIFSGFNARCVNIVTTKPEEIKEQIFKILGRGITIVAAKGGYTGNDKTILVCVMHNQEFYKMKEIIRSIDEKAFIYNINDVVFIATCSKMLFFLFF